MHQNSKDSLIIRAAELYYEQNQNQADIARALKCSHSTVSRLLTNALKSGIVRINIKRPVEKMPKLAEQINEKFNLKDVIVVSNGISNEHALNHVGYASAELLSQIIHSNVVIGISFGETLRHVADALNEFSFDYEGVEVIQLMGGLGAGDPSIDGPELAQKMAMHLGATYRYIQAPAVLESPGLAQQLMQEKYISETISRAEKAEIIISSVGSLAGNLSSMERSGYFKKDDRAEYLALGAIGNSLGRLIDKNGNPIKHSFNECVIGASLDVFFNAKWSIGICANPIKASVILAAVKGHHFNALVIDDGTARELLRLHS